MKMNKLFKAIFLSMTLLSLGSLVADIDPRFESGRANVRRRAHMSQMHHRGAGEFRHGAASRGEWNYERDPSGQVRAHGTWGRGRVGRSEAIGGTRRSLHGHAGRVGHRELGAGTQEHEAGLE